MTQSILLLSSARAVDATEGRRRAEQVRALRTRPSSPARSNAEITVRVLRESDRPALARLAGRDSAVAPDGQVLGAEIDGVLVATIALADGSVIADPFRSTSSAVELLRLRVQQLEGPKSRRRLPRLSRRRTSRAHGALAGSPPGSSRLLQL